MTVVWKLFLLVAGLALVTASASVDPSPSSALTVAFFDLRPIQAGGDYETAIFLLALQGLVNRLSDQPQIFMNTTGNSQCRGTKSDKDVRGCPYGHFL